MLQTKKGGKNNKVGAIGEQIACHYLENKGFTLLDRNYLQKWGEIDLVMHHNLTVHFVEVKTVSFPSSQKLERAKNSGHRPEEQLTQAKYDRLSRTIDTWIASETFKGQYQLDLVTVYLVPQETYAQVEYFANIVVD